MGLAGYLEYVAGSIYSRGALSTARLVASELLFDVRHGVDTIGMVALDELADIGRYDRRSGNRYQGGNPSLFFRLFQTLASDYGYNFANEHFVDFGCGKGRALLMALALGFGEVTGIEWSPTLCAIGRKNIDTYRRHHPTAVDARIICGNAVDIACPDSATVLFYFNPFKAPVLEAVLRNVHESRIRSPRRITHVYLNPVHRIVFARPGVDRLLSFSGNRGGHEDAVVYVEGY